MNPRMRILTALLLVPLAASHAAEIHIQDFGAAGNGTADDTAALEKAVAVLAAAPKPAVLRFAAGRTYRIVSGTGYAIRLQDQEHVRIEGAGAILLLGADRRGVALHGCQDVAVHELRVDYDLLPFAEALVIGVDQASRAVVARIDDGFAMPPPDWWAAMHPDDLVQTLTAAPDSKPEPGAGGWRVASFASKPYWEACERAARDLGRYVKQHPEGWRVLAVTYSGGGCEFFPHWGEGRYSDYSPAFLAGFRDWLTTRYETDAKLRAAWKNDDVSLVTAALPTPAERRRGDWFDFYDPAKGEQRIDFCRYYAEVTTGLITRLAKALKEGSDGRFYTRPMAGYQPCGPHFRFHAGPHADFATVLECPWIDGFFMPNDYYGRGHGGYTAFEIPVASVLLHGKTYITEIDDRTHLTTQFGQFGGLESATETPWQTAQVAKRTVAAVLCNASGGEFKDWANGWWEDLETMNLIRQLNQLAQESANHDRTQIAQIAVVINPRSTMYLRDDSKLYSTLNLQQMHLVYPRIGAPHDRIMIDDLAKARDYDLYIVQDCLYLTEAQRRMLRDKTCRAGKTVLWLFAPGIVGDGGLRGVDGVSDLVGIRLAVHDATTRYCLKFSNGMHPYTRGVAGTEHFTFEDFGPLFHVDDPDATVLGMGRYHMGLTRPAFAVKKQADWTSVYCGLPVLPPAVLRDIAREAGVHIYTDNDDFMAANNWLLTVCAASDGPRHDPAAEERDRCRRPDRRDDREGRQPIPG